MRRNGRETNRSACRMAGSMAAMLLLALLLGCAKESGMNDNALVSVESSGMTILWHGNFGETIEQESFIERELEKRFRVSIQYDNANNNQLSLMAAANELPDVIRLPDPRDVADYAKAGLLLELPPELLESKTPEIYKAIDATGWELWQLTDYNGQNYAIPQVVQYVTWDTAMKWRSDILQLAGISSIPRTVAEYDEAFRAVKIRKPEIIRATNPKLSSLYMFSGAEMALPWNQFTWLFGAYDSMPGTWQLDDAGRVTRGELLPGTRDALAKLHEWYMEGYIDPAFVINQSEQFADKWESGLYVVNGATGFIGDAKPVAPGEPIRPTDAKLASNVPSAELAWEKSPIGPDGEQGVFSWGQRQNFFAVSSRLKDEPEKLAKVLEMIEEIASDDELWLLASYGIENESYRFDADGRPVFIHPYDDIKTPEAKRMGAMGPSVSPFAPFASAALTDRYTDKSVADTWKRLNTARTDVLFGLPLSSSQEMEQLNQDKWTETMIQIITGVKPLSFYDEYIKWFYDNGGSEWTREANELYQSRFKGK